MKNCYNYFQNGNQLASFYANSIAEADKRFFETCNLDPSRSGITTTVEVHWIKRIRNKIRLTPHKIHQKTHKIRRWYWIGRHHIYMAWRYMASSKFRQQLRELQAYKQQQEAAKNSEDAIKGKIKANKRLQNLIASKAGGSLTIEIVVEVPPNTDLLQLKENIYNRLNYPNTSLDEHDLGGDVVSIV